MALIFIAKALEMHKQITPSSHWRNENKEDPFGDRYKCGRESLTLGNQTDDELANSVFMYGNDRPDIEKLLSGEAHLPITYLTAAKDRIRWLSRQNDAKESRIAEMELALRQLVNALDTIHQEQAFTQDFDITICGYKEAKKLIGLPATAEQK